MTTSDKNSADPLRAGSGHLEQSAPDDESRNVEKPAAEKPRVLVVDDETFNLDTFQRVFRKHFQIFTATSARAALRELETQQIDVALLDYAMPSMNGVALLHAAVSLQPAVTYFMMTAHADAQEVRDTVKAGLSYGIIMKPWNRDEVLRWVANGHRLSLLRRSVKDMKRSI